MLNARVWLMVMLGTSVVVAFLGVPSPVQALKHWAYRATHSTQRIDLYNQPCYSEIVPGLYLSNLKAATDRDVLRNLHITHVLTIEAQRLSKTVFENTSITNLFIKAYDTVDTNLLPYFPMSNAFIGNAISSGGNVLVHCRFGVSRSATLVIAYIMEKYTLSFEQAFDFVKTKRFFINPNPGFVRQLQEYYRLGYQVKGFHRFEAFMATKAKDYRCRIVSAAVILVTILVPIVIMAVAVLW